MLASIRASGGVGGGGLKKVSDKEKRDRSAVAVPGAEPNAHATDAPSAPAGGGGSGLQDALAAALSKRNKKVSKSGKRSILSCHHVSVANEIRQMTRTTMMMIGSRWGLFNSMWTKACVVNGAVLAMAFGR